MREDVAVATSFMHEKCRPIVRRVALRSSSSSGLRQGSSLACAQQLKSASWKTFQAHE